MWSEGIWLGVQGEEESFVRRPRLAWWPNIVEFYFGEVLVWVRAEGVLAH